MKNNYKWYKLDTAAKLAEVSSALLEKIDNTESKEVITVNPETKENVANMWETTYGGWNI